MTDSLPRQSEPVAFSATPEVWRRLVDQWYGGKRSAPFDLEVHKAAEKLMADIGEVVDRAAA